MQTHTHEHPLAGRVLSGIAIAFLTLDSAGKLARLQPVIDGTIQLGYPREMAFILGVVLLACVILYAIPRTAALGALLLTGYLGGAVASQARLQMPLASHTLFPVYFAILIWAGLVLRDARLRALLPMRRSA